MAQALLALTTLLVMLNGNLAGTWTGVASDSEGGRQGAYLQLREEGNTITGVAGADQDHCWPIKRVIYSGDHLTFGVTSTNQTGEQANWIFDLKVDGDRMTGTGEASRGGQSWKVDLTLSRQK
jgi:hypothetical protein